MVPKIKSVNVEISVIADMALWTGPLAVPSERVEFKAGQVLKADLIDENGFAFLYSLDTGLFENEYELYVPCLENK